MFDAQTQSCEESFDTGSIPPPSGVYASVSALTIPNRPVRRLAPNSDAEFKVLYETNVRVVRCALSRLGVRESDLKDMTQKVFLVAFRKLPEFEGRSSLSTWLWGICRRVAIAYRRSGIVRREVATDPCEVEAFLDVRGAMYDEPARDAAVEHLLGKLSDSQRLVFKLSEVDELNGSQIARMLNVSIGTVRSRLRYARQRIRRELKRLRVSSAFSKKATAQRAVTANGQHFDFAG